MSYVGSPSGFEQWITPVLPFMVMPPKISNTGAFELWITPVLPFNVYAAAPSGLADRSVNVSDSITHSESTGLASSTLEVNKTESINVSENPVLITDYFVNKSESITVRDFSVPIADVATNPGKFENWIEVNHPFPVMWPKTDCTGTFQRWLTVSQPIPVLVGVLAGANKVTSPTVGINVSDTVSIIETGDMDIPVFGDVYVSDTIYVIEPPFQSTTELAITVDDDITVTESTTVSIQAASSVSLSVSDSITVSSPAPGIYVQPIVELYIELDDHINAMEFVDGSYPLGIAIMPDSVFAPGIRIRV